MIATSFETIARPKPGAAVQPRGRLVGLFEGLKDQPLLFVRNANAGVRDGEVQADLVGGLILERIARATTSPCSVNLIALPTRLTTICRSRIGSPTSTSGTSGMNVAGQFQALGVSAIAERLDRVAQDFCAD